MTYSRCCWKLAPEIQQHATTHPSRSKLPNWAFHLLTVLNDSWSCSSINESRDMAQDQNILSLKTSIDTSQHILFCWLFLLTLINPPRLHFEASPEAICISSFVCMVSLHLFNVFVSQESLWSILTKCCGTKQLLLCQSSRFPETQNKGPNLL